MDEKTADDAPACLWLVVVTPFGHGTHLLVAISMWSHGGVLLLRRAESTRAMPPRSRIQRPPLPYSTGRVSAVALSLALGLTRGIHLLVMHAAVA